MAKNQVRIGVGVDDRASKPIKGIRDAFQRLQTQGAQGFAIGAGAAITTKAFDVLGSAVRGVTDFMGDSIRAASDLGEQMSKSTVVFGDASDEIQDFAEKAGSAFGLSKRAALEAASGFGQFFKGAGESQAAAEDMSERIVALGADLASFNNLDPTEVLQKLQSGLSGEAEPMRRLGVFLTEAKVKAKAMEMGLAGANGELTEGAKVLARYQIILDETKDAQGDFARTSDGLANQQRVLNAELENAQAALGETLIPFQTAVTKAEIGFLRFVKSGVEGWQMLGDAIGDVGTEAKDGGDGLFHLKEKEEDAGRAALQLATAQDNAKRAGRGLNVEARELAENLDDVGDESRDTAGDIRDMRRDLRNAEISARGLAGAMDDLTDALFGTQIRAGELAQAKQNLAELKKAGPDSKSANDIDIYNGKLAELRLRIFEIENEQAKAAGKKEYLAWLIEQRLSLGELNDEYGAYLDNLIRAAQLEGAAASGGGTGRRATSSRSAPTTTTPAPAPTVTIPHGAIPTFAEGGTVPGPEGRPQLILAHGGEEVTPAGGGGTTIINLTVQGDIRARDKEAVVRELVRAAAFVRG